MRTDQQRQNTDELTHVGGSEPQKTNSCCLCLVRCPTGSFAFPKCERLLCLTYHTTQKTEKRKEKKTRKQKREGRKEEYINISTLRPTGIVKCFCFKSLNSDPLQQFLPGKY